MGRPLARTTRPRLFPRSGRTGGTGGLGSAVTAALLDRGWRVVVPWVAEKELDRVGEHERLHLVRADLFDEASVTRCADLAAADRDAPLRAVVNLVGGFAPDR